MRILDQIDATYLADVSPLVLPRESLVADKGSW